MTKRNEILKKIKESGELHFDTSGIALYIDFYKSNLIEELYAIEKAECILAWLKPDRVAHQPLDNETVGKIADSLVKMAQYRHNFECGQRGSRDYTKLYSAVETDFFGGLWLTNLVYILDTVASQQETGQDQQG